MSKSSKLKSVIDHLAETSVRGAKKLYPLPAERKERLKAFTTEIAEIQKHLSNSPTGTSPIRWKGGLGVPTLKPGSTKGFSTSKTSQSKSQSPLARRGKK
jgi:hypothetical protein